MRRIEQTNQFKRDFKKIAASGRYKKKDFLDVVELLVHDKPLPEKYRDHALYNNWKSYRECRRCHFNCVSSAGGKFIWIWIHQSTCLISHTLSVVSKFFY